MKPVAFDYLAPATLDEALSALAQYGLDAKLIAGGQSLMPLLNMRLVRPKVLIDLSRIASERYIRIDDTHITIGALTRHRDIERSQPLRAACPLLPAAEAFVAHEPIRSRGTIGGSLAHADPAAELPLVLSALPGTVILARSATQTREIPIEDFFLTYYTTTLEADEIITAVRIPRPPVPHGWSIHEFARRHGDFATAAVAAYLEVDAARNIQHATLAFGGLADRPITTQACQDVLVQDPANVGEAASAALADIDIEGDLHASAEDRRAIAQKLAECALAEAYERAAGATGATSTVGAHA